MTPAVRRSVPTAYLASLYGAGLDFAQVGERVGMSKSAVHKRLSDLPDFKPRRGGQPSTPRAAIQYVCRLYAVERMTVPEISEEVGISKTAVYKRLELGGVKRRPALTRVCWKCDEPKHASKFRGFGTGEISRVCRKCEEGERCE